VRVGSNRQGLRQRRLHLSYGFRHWETTLGGNRPEFRHHSRRLPRTTHEPDFPAGVPPPGPALIALPARNRGFNRHPLAGTQVFHIRSDFHHGPGTLMAHGLRILDALGADASRGIVMDIGTADAHPVDAHQDVLRTLQLGLGRFSYFHISQPGQVYDFHGSPREWIHIKESRAEALRRRELNLTKDI
jgi:hypothetical protein